MKEEWMEKKDSFEIIDVRKLTSNFLPMILMKAKRKNVGEGLCVVQTFEPKPLYSALEDLGYEHTTEKISEREYRVYFYRVKQKDITYESGADMPFKPTAILNYKKIDDDLAENVVNFWELVWEKKDAAIDQKTKLLLSMANAVGASRFRQATRELIKAYSLGVTTAEFDEIFTLFAWNQGIGHFSSEIGPSVLFGVYQQIKNKEKAGTDKKTIIDEVMEMFGDRNPEVSTQFSFRKGKPCPKYP